MVQIRSGDQPLRIGDVVRVAETGRMGEVTRFQAPSVDRLEYLVRFPDGDSAWFNNHELRKVQ